MNRTTLLVIAVFAVSLFAGCIAGDEQVEPEEEEVRNEAEEVKVTATTGSIKGTVASDLFEPLGGAKVYLVETEKETTVARNGEFVFNELAPQTYTMQIVALGYEQAARSLKVVAGEVATVNIIMVPAASDDPFMVFLEEVGLVNVAAAWQLEVPGVGCTNVEIVKNCGGVRLGTNSEHALEIDPEVKTIVAEMVWSPAGPLGEYLSLDLLCSEVPRGASGAVTDINHPCFFEPQTRSSPIVHRVDEEHWLEHGYNHTGAWAARIFGTYGTLGTYDAIGMDVGVAYEQKFTVYYSIFHKEGAPEGYTGIPDA